MKIYNKKINIETEKTIKNYKFCVLSDIHNNNVVKYKMWEQIIKKVSKENPDYIFIPGDIIQDANDIVDKDVRKKLEFLFEGLQNIAPTFVSLGNHDLKDGTENNAAGTLRYLKSLETKNLFILNNETIELTDLTITGFSPRFETYYGKVLPGHKDKFIEDLKNYTFKFKKNKYNIFLTHSPLLISLPETFEETNKIINDVDLILSGHMHDGYIPKLIQKLGIVKGEKGLRVDEGKNLRTTSVGIAYKCRGQHKVLNSILIITGGIRKLSHNMFLFNQIGKLWSKDITTIDLKQVNDSLEK